MSERVHAFRIKPIPESELSLLIFETLLIDFQTNEYWVPRVFSSTLDELGIDLRIIVTDNRYSSDEPGPLQQTHEDSKKMKYKKKISLTTPSCSLNSS